MRSIEARAARARRAALEAFGRVRQALPALESVFDEDPEHVDLTLDFPAQAQLAFPVHLNLQNIDELHLCAGSFWLEWFPCCDPARREEYVEAVVNLVKGSYRILEHRRGARAVRAELQEPAGDTWRTIGSWATLALPWPRKHFTVLRNDRFGVS